MSGAIVCVGDRLGNQDDYIAGPGTYVRNGYIHSSVVGFQRMLDEASTSKLTIEVHSQRSVPKVPKPGDVVTGKILRVQQNSAQCKIVCVGTRALEVDFRGLIRLADVRATEIDKVVMQDCFRPGDIVRAEVLSLGDARSYYLSTAKNELGVVYAKSANAGVPMVAISWEEMQCPETQTNEKRKIAKF
ncbi:hypothetical protein CEUSTIGMA_g4922.t1 [Chlamydomonas eustigma]|uniref:S1 motif domain-containing protein n=1 Tax=Chlamydomonas eustigma TaxID=1157962 RepID=A0A250X331_9CHLO|nr:hypothetical protein CEUSTIGMA_g4922.t1 [Chlamydomonas eustigma]|eukprot:GAX77478.1 hypothetical protein CEUSTIGMA_g4922.t1 [Chlamydomonas eustigma]